jgi:hypothetical protein
VTTPSPDDGGSNTPVFEESLSLPLLAAAACGLLIFRKRFPLCFANKREEHEEEEEEEGTKETEPL